MQAPHPSPQRLEYGLKPQDPSAKVNEVTDQCHYLQYVLDALTRKNQEQYEILYKAARDIEKNVNVTICQLNEAKQELLSQIYRINEENQGYAKRVYEDIHSWINRRLELKARIGKAFVSEIFVSEKDVKEFAGFDYPRVFLKFSTVRLRFDEEKVRERVRKVVGGMDRIALEGKEEEDGNDKMFKKHKAECQGRSVSPSYYTQNYRSLNQSIPSGSNMNQTVPTSSIRKY